MYNIAIDGPAGAGKSTIARQIAKRKGYIQLRRNLRVYRHKKKYADYFFCSRGQKEQRSYAEQLQCVLQQ